MNTKELVRNRIIELIKEREIKVGTLATASGVPPTTLKNILYGNTQNTGIVTIKKLCDGLNISLFDFFSTEEFKNSEQELK